MPDFHFAAFMEHFHWQRPLWLLVIPVALFAAWYLLRGQSQNNQWKSLINPQLLPYLLQGSLSKQQRWPLLMMATGLIIAGLSMAGPSWEKLPQPIHKTESAMVILLDMSPSMMAEDLKPSRLVRARLKLTDLLKQRQEGLTALVAYAGEAYTVTPLTDDSDTIISLLPALAPDVMPQAGSNTEMALDRALTLFKDSGLSQGDILLVTDGVTTEAQQYLRRSLPPGFRLSILGVGTKAGAPIPLRHGGFAKDNNSAIVLAKLNSNELAQLSEASGGKYRTLSSDDKDINALTEQPELLSQKTRQLERQFDTWVDRGAWLMLLLIPFVAFSFRKGWLLLIPFCLVMPEKSYAFGWQDLWQTPDQQAQQLLQQDKAAEAAETFQRKDWKAAAQYKAQDFKSAAETFAQDKSATGQYNQGNALAKAGKLPEAIKAYDEALKQQPDFDDAAANKKLVEDLLKQQQEQQEQQQDQQNQSGDSDQQNQDQNQPSKNQDQQQDGQDSDQQSSDQKNSQDQQESENNSDQDQKGQDPEDQNQEGQSQEGQDQQDQNDEQQEDSQQNAENNESETNEEPSESAQAQAAEESDLSDEEKQAMEQWLRKIPDDPSGLMRKKFEYQYRQRRLEHQQGSWQPPGNESTQRW